MPAGTAHLLQLLLDEPLQLRTLPGRQRHGGGRQRGRARSSAPTAATRGGRGGAGRGGKRAEPRLAASISECGLAGMFVSCDGGGPDFEGFTLLMVSGCRGLPRGAGGVEVGGLRSERLRSF